MLVMVPADRVRIAPPQLVPQPLPHWASGLTVAPNDHIVAACAAYGNRERWAARKPAASSASDSEHSAEHKALSGSVALDWKRTLDNWDRWEPEFSPRLL